MAKPTTLKEAREKALKSLERHKTCTGCGGWKALSDYHKNRSTKDGFAYQCKVCQNGAAKKTIQKRRDSNDYKFVEEKVCPRCNCKKRAICFAKDAARVDCLTLYCKVCMNSEKREKYKKDSLRFLSRAKRYFLSKLEMSIDDYKTIEKRQKKLCAICGLPETRQSRGRKQRLAIDHNHNTMKFRGLLCAKCNTALGLLNVDNFGILNLQRATSYLQERQDVTS
jgi:hypothetical protein